MKFKKEEIKIVSENKILENNPIGRLKKGNDYLVLK